MVKSSKLRGAVKLVLSAAITAGLIGGVAQVGAQSTGGMEGYDAPRYPRFVINPTKEELMAQARVAVRQTAGRAPLGNMKSGETAYVVLEYEQDQDVWNAIKTAWQERGVEAKVIPSYEIYGMSKQDFDAQQSKNYLNGGDGWMEWKIFESVYATFLPESVQATFKNPIPSQKEMGGASPTATVPPFILYLRKHPEIKNFYAWMGGGGIQKAIFRAHMPEAVAMFRGNWTFTRKADLMNKMTSFPGDVWKMVDEEMVRPIGHVSEGWITDPEGTNMHWTLMPTQSVEWDKRSGVGNINPNHLNLYPPPVLATWPEGIVIRAEASHTGYYPTMTAHMDQHGKVVQIEGGGRNGDLFRMMLNHPLFRDVKFPSAPEPGYWYLAQDGFATNPKAIRNIEELMEGSPGLVNTAERERAGVQHFAFSGPMPIEGRDPRDVAVAKEQGLPLTHTAHMHNYFTTIKWRLRDTGEIVTVSEKGHPEIFKSAELRALVSKYGNPDTIFSYDWVPDMPGVNMPGNHDRDYGADPFAFLKAEWALLKSGKYTHYVENYKVTN
jgi:hypothetical protein